MADAAIHGHEHEDERGFFTRWFMSTNHKDIGILYLFVVGACRASSRSLFTVYMRLELMEPGVQYMCHGRRAPHRRPPPATCTPNGHLWNVMITGHGILMMFFVVIPALFGGFGNYFMPLQIGAPDMAFPRMNNLQLLALCRGHLAGGLFGASRRAATVSSARASAGCSTRRCRSVRAAIRWTSRSSRCTSRAPRRSWARST